MIKTISIIVSAMAVLLASLFSSPEPLVSVTCTVAPKLVPGEDCLVKVTLSKGSVTGYGRLQQVLPLGLKAVPVETSGALFTIDENIVKFEWDELPGDDVFTIAYKIQTDPNATQKEEVPGAFFYLTNEGTKMVELDPVSLNFAPPVAEQSGDVKRKIVAVTPESGEYLVELSIRKEMGKQSAKFTDQIPEGYTVTDINTNGAKFLFSDRQASFHWEQLPKEAEFKISYHLHAQNEEFEKPVVTGMMVYDDVQVQHSTAIPATTTAAIETTDEVAERIATALAAQEKEKALQASMSTLISKPNAGIFYKIQIAATRKSPIRDDHFFEDKFGLSQHVDIAEQDGWRKYMIGNFDTYSSAFEFNERTKTKIPDAFVVAYRNAERIPIREAQEAGEGAN